MEDVTEIRNSAFFESKATDLERENKSLAYDNAVLSKENDDLRADIKKYYLINEIAKKTYYDMISKNCKDKTETCTSFEYEPVDVDYLVWLSGFLASSGYGGYSDNCGRY